MGLIHLRAELDIQNVNNVGRNRAFAQQQKSDVSIILNSPKLVELSEPLPAHNELI